MPKVVARITRTAIISSLSIDFGFSQMKSILAFYAFSAFFRKNLFLRWKNEDEKSAAAEIIIFGPTNFGGLSYRLTIVRPSVRLSVTSFPG